MKKFLILSLIAGPLVSASAQQIPLYSHLFFAQAMVNPAKSGAAGFSELVTMHRQQWQGMEGAPETSALLFNGATNKERVGYSVYAFTDATDIVRRSGIYGHYAYHAQLSENAVLSFGLGAGYVNNTFDMASIRVKNEGDPFLFPANTNGTLDINAGLNLKVENFQLGVAAPQLLAPAITYSNNYAGPVAFHLIRHYVVHTQYDLPIQKDRMTLTPLVVVRAANHVTPQVDAGMMFNMKEYGYLGALYRSNFGASAQVGVHLTPLLTLGYAHDFSTNTFATSLGVSNEFMLTYRFGDNKRNDRIEAEIKRLKDKQRQADQNNEKLLNEKFEEFKEELEAANKKQLEAQSEQLAQATAMKLQEAGAQAGGVRGAASQRGATTPSTATPAQGAVQTEGSIRGYSADAYADRVAPGSVGYYVTAGVYGEQENADRMVAKLKAQGISSRTFRDPKNNMVYVYLLKFGSYEEASTARQSGLNGQYSGKLWVKVIQ
ncbi:MAG: PorP/SprF family type IX secretion system membrane protein [Schleiferiaceae bacterium]